jgi:phosphomannomutase
MNIYQIENEYQLLINQIIENGGEITPEQELALSLTKDNIQKKAVDYGFVIKQIQDRKRVRKEYIDKLKHDNDIDDNLEERLKAILTKGMNIFELDEVKTPLIKINFRKSEQVVVNDVNALPSDYKTIKVTEQPDKIKIKQAIKSGEDILGCELITVQNLQIK